MEHRVPDLNTPVSYSRVLATEKFAMAMAELKRTVSNLGPAVSASFPPVLMKHSQSWPHFQLKPTITNCKT